jgi:hypothetical protein
VNKVLDFVSSGMGKRDHFVSTVKFSGASSQETGVRCYTTRKFACTCFQLRSLQFTSVIMFYAAKFNTLNCHFLVFS